MNNELKGGRYNYISLPSWTSKNKLDHYCISQSDCFSLHLKNSFTHSPVGSTSLSFH